MISRKKNSRMLKRVPIAKEVQLAKGKKRKKELEINYEKELTSLKNTEKLHKKPKIDKATRLENVMVNESNDDALNINDLPNEAILKIFGYLKQIQLGQIARVCRRWNALTSSPVLWKKVNVQFPSSHKSASDVTESFINRLPSCVTSIRLDFALSCGRLDFVEFCISLKQNCPNLDELILTRSDFSRSFSSVIDICINFLPDLKKLVFRYCMFVDCGSAGEYGGISEMEILYVFKCDESYYGCLDKPPFSRMPGLKELHLYGSYTCDAWFEDDASFLNQLNVLNLGSTCVTPWTFSAIRNHGRNIKELCLSLSELQNRDLNFNRTVFPQLKKICLIDSEDVTCEGIVSLLRSCQSLQDVFVDEDVARSFEAHPFVVASRCKPGIVKAVDCDHGLL